MILRLLPLLAFACLGEALRISHGHYNFSALLWLVGAAIALVLAVLLPRSGDLDSVSFASKDARWWVCLGLLQGLHLVWSPGLIYADPSASSAAWQVLEALLMAACALGAGALAWSIWRKGRSTSQMSAMLWVAAALLILPFRLLGDVRLAGAAATVATVLVVRRLTSAGAIGARLAWVWAGFPVLLFNIEQAWVDLLLVPWVLASAVFLKNRKWMAGGVVLGLAASVKQVALGALVFAAVSVFYAASGQGQGRRLGWRSFGQFAGGAGLALTIVLLPWMLWDFHGFWLGVAKNLISFAPRADALTWSAHSWLTLGAPLSPPLLWGVVLSGFFLGVRASRSEHPSGWLLGSGILFLLAFMVSKQAFCNYYTWVASLIWAHLALRDAVLK